MVKLDDPQVRAAYEEENLGRMSFGDHLDELRKRLVRSLAVVFIAVLGVMPFKDGVQHIVTEPYRVQWRIGFNNWIAELEQREAAGDFVEDGDTEGRDFLAYCRKHHDAILSGEKRYKSILPDRTGYNVPYTLVAINGLEDMFNYMFAAILFAIVLASPYVVWQAWGFIAAGLFARERRLFYRYFPFMVGLFASGVSFGYFLVLPFSLGFLISLMNPEQVGAMLSVGQYFSLLFALTAALGLVFQLPLVMVALQRVGLVTHAAFLKHWRITVLIIALSAAIFTPPEPVSMLLTMTPMVGLYGLGLILTAMGRSSESKIAADIKAQS